MKAVNLFLVDTEGQLLYGHALARRLIRHDECQEFRGIELGNFSAYLEARYWHVPEVQALVKSFETYMLREPHDKRPVDACLEAVSAKVKLDLADVRRLYAAQEWMRKQGFSSNS
jgi:hypothetical protein